MVVLVLKAESDMNRNAIWAFSPAFASAIQFPALKSTVPIREPICAPPCTSQSVPPDGSNPCCVFFSHGSELCGSALGELWCNWGSSVQLCLEEARKHHHSSYQSIEHVKIKQTGAQTGLTWVRPLIFVESLKPLGLWRVSKSRILDSNVSSATPLHLSSLCQHVGSHKTISEVLALKSADDCHNKFKSEIRLIHCSALTHHDLWDFRKAESL